jgi:hypothetical protein
MTGGVHPPGFRPVNMSRCSPHGYLNHLSEEPVAAGGSGRRSSSSSSSSYTSPSSSSQDLLGSRGPLQTGLRSQAGGEDGSEAALEDFHRAVLPDQQREGGALGGALSRAKETALQLVQSVVGVF